MSLTVSEYVFRDWLRGISVFRAICTRYVVSFVSCGFVALIFAIILIYTMFPLLACSDHSLKGRFEKANEFITYSLLYVFDRSKFTESVTEALQKYHRTGDICAVLYPPEPGYGLESELRQFEGDLRLELFSFLGTILMSLSVIFIIPVINGLYLIGVVLGRAHTIMLDWFGFKHSKVLDDPLVYIGYLLSGVVFVVSTIGVILINTF